MAEAATQGCCQVPHHCLRCSLAFSSKVSGLRGSCVLSSAHLLHLFLLLSSYQGLP